MLLEGFQSNTVISNFWQSSFFLHIHSLVPTKACPYLEMPQENSKKQSLKTLKIYWENIQDLGNNRIVFHHTF